MSDVDAVIAALRVVLHEAETRTRETIAAQRPWWPFGRRATNAAPEAAIAVAKEKQVSAEKPQEAPRVPDRSTKPKGLN